MEPYVSVLAWLADVPLFWLALLAFDRRQNREFLRGLYAQRRKLRAPK
jgi:hypothetical protein